MKSSLKRGPQLRTTKFSLYSFLVYRFNQPVKSFSYASLFTTIFVKPKIWTGTDWIELFGNSTQIDQRFVQILENSVD